jgi:hypothetical protein
MSAPIGDRTPAGPAVTDLLVEFLRARLDEDEWAALNAAGAPWTDDIPGMIHVDSAAQRENKLKYGHLGYVAGAEPSPLGDAYRRHIVLHDPARVLRGVEAKRRLLEAHQTPGRAPCDAHDASLHSIPCEVLMLLAAEWSDHPDYQASQWKPYPPTAIR